MKPQLLLVIQFKQLLIICSGSILAGIIYQSLLLGYFDHNAFILGLMLGLGFYLFKYFASPKLDKAILRFPLLIKILTYIY